VVDPVNDTDVSEKEQDLVGCPADDESAANDHRRHGGVATSFACGGTVWRKHLKNINDLATITICQHSAAD